MTMIIGISGLPNVVAIIDGTHVPIQVRAFQEQYFNHKERHTINNQVVIDGKRHIVDLEAGYPGSMHDARVFRRSELARRLENGQLLQGPGVVYQNQMLPQVSCNYGGHINIVIFLKSILLVLVNLRCLVCPAGDLGRLGLSLHPKCRAGMEEGQPSAFGSIEVEGTF